MIRNRRKIPLVAGALNIIPGLGYLYAGVRRPFTGMLLLGAAITVVGTVVSSDFANSTSDGTVWDNAVTAVFLLAFMVDAYLETATRSDR
jgi:hypothetical protein